MTSSRLNNDTKPGDDPDSSIKYWKVPSLQNIPNPHKISESHPACSKWVYDIAANNHSSNDRFFAACSTHGAREYNQKFDYLPGRRSGRVTSALAVSPVDHVLAVGTSELTIELWSICADDSPSTCSSELLRELKGHSSEITNLKFSHDGNMLISGDQDGHVLVWDMKRTALSPTPPSMAYSAISSDGCESIKKPPLGSRAMLYLPKHQIWVTSVLSDKSSHGSIQLWDKNFKQIVSKFRCFSDKPAPTTNASKEPIGPIESMAFDAEEKYLFIGRYSNSSSGCRTEIDGLIRGEPFSCEKIIGKGRVWSIKSSTITPEIIFGNLISSAYFINSQSSNQAHLINRQEFMGTISIDRHPKHLNQIAFGGYSGSVTLTDSISNPTHSTELLTQKERTSVIRNIKFSPDGTILAAIGEGKKLFLWDVSNGHSDKHEKYQFEDSLISMAFSPDSKSILIGTSNGHLHFFDMESKTSTPILTDSDGIKLDNRGAIWSIVFDQNNSAFIYTGEHKKFDATATAYTYYGSMPYYTNSDAIRRRICNYLGSASGEAGIDCSSFSASATP